MSDSVTELVARVRRWQTATRWQMLFKNAARFQQHRDNAESIGAASRSRRDDETERVIRNELAMADECHQRTLDLDFELAGIRDSVREVMPLLITRVPIVDPFHDEAPDEQRVREWRKDMRAIGTALQKSMRPGSENSYAAVIRLLSVYTNGLADERFGKAANVLDDDKLTLDEKLWKINDLMPMPPTVSAAMLGKLFTSKKKPNGVSKTAIQNTKWYRVTRKGEKDNEIGRRHEQHRERAQQFERDGQRDADDD